MTRGFRIGVVGLAALAGLTGCADPQAPSGSRSTQGVTEICSYVVVVQPGASPIDPVIPSASKSGSQFVCPPTPSGSRPTSPAPATSSAPAPAPRLKKVPEPADVRSFGWVERGYNALSESATLTLIRGLTPRQALAIVSAGEARTPIESAAKARAWVDRQRYSDQHVDDLVEAGTRGGVTIVLEENGFAATDDGVARRLGRAGTAAVIYNQTDVGLSEFKYVVGGRLVRDMDPFDGSTAGAQTTKPLPQERGIPFGKGDFPYLAQSLALTRRLTGFRVLPSDLQDGRFTLAVGVEY